MKVIDYDPTTKIPPLHENDLTRKMLINIIHSLENEFVAFATKKSNNTIGFLGADSHNDLRWLSPYDDSITLLGLIINEWEDMRFRLLCGWKMEYLVIESLEELTMIIEQHQIINPLRRVMIMYWLNNHSTDRLRVRSDSDEGH